MMRSLSLLSLLSLSVFMNAMGAEGAGNVESTESVSVRAVAEAGIAGSARCNNRGVYQDFSGKCACEFNYSGDECAQWTGPLYCAPYDSDSYTLELTRFHHMNVNELKLHECEFFMQHLSDVFVCLRTAGGGYVVGLNSSDESGDELGSDTQYSLSTCLDLVSRHAMPEGLPMPCDSNPCANGGTCRNNNYQQYTCICPDGFVGSDCKQIDPCLQTTPCLNGGKCTSVATGSGCFSATCDCRAPYYGVYCQCLRSQITTLQKCVRKCASQNKTADFQLQTENHCRNECRCVAVPTTTTSKTTRKTSSSTKTTTRS